MKEIIVSDGHITDLPRYSVYSGVFSLRGFHLVLVLAELNNRETCATDIGNTYLESYTTEKHFSWKEMILENLKITCSLLKIHVTVCALPDFVDTINVLLSP